MRRSYRREKSSRLLDREIYNLITAGAASKRAADAERGRRNTLLMYEVYTRSEACQLLNKIEIGTRRVVPDITIGKWLTRRWWSEPSANKTDN